MAKSLAAKQSSDRIEAFANEVAERIDAAAARGSTDIPDSRLSVILKKCGYARRTTQLLQRVQIALEARGVTTDPLLTASDIALTQRIFFLRGDQPLGPHPVLFSSERPLEDLLAANLGLLPDLAHLKLIRRQHRLPSGCRVDLLCRDRKTGDYVVVELKHAEADRGVVAQIFQYLSELAPTASSEGRGLRGLLITGRRDAYLETMIQALSQQTGFTVDWRIYRLSLELQSND